MTEGATKIRVMIASAHATLSLLLNRLIVGQQDMILTGIHRQLNTLQDEVVSKKPDVLLLTWDWNADLTTEIMRQIRMSFPELYIICLADYYEQAQHVDKIVSKIMDMPHVPTEILATIRQRPTSHP